MTTDTLALPRGGRAAAASASPAAPATAAPRGHGEQLSARYKFLIWLPVILLLAGALALWEFVSYALMSAPALNGKILLCLAWGVWTMSGHVRGIYKEDRVFRSGMAWLKGGARSGVQDPRLGESAFVTGMIERLSKLGLGHQVYVHSAATEPEFEALSHYLERKQELSQFLVGLMVGLGLLGTFIGLLQTLVATSDLIGTIAAGAGGGGKMEEEFAKIVGGLQKPLTAMGTAFSASMFGLVGSILLGFQLVIVRKCATDFVEVVRSDVLSMAEASTVNKEVEITERFLASLLADVLEQHRATDAGLQKVAHQIETLVPEVRETAAACGRLAERVSSQEAVLERTVAAVAVVGTAAPAMSRLAESSEGVLLHSQASLGRIDRMLEHLPQQQQLMEHLHEAMGRVDTLGQHLQAVKTTTDALREEVRGQAVALKRMDGTLWNLEQDGLRRALGEPPKGF